MVTVVFYAVGASIDQYIEVCRIAGISQANVPNGLIFHTSSTTEDGFLVLDVWESRQHFEEFVAKVGPAMDEAGLGGIEPKFYPTHFVMGSCQIPPMDPLKTNMFSD